MHYSWLLFATLVANVPPAKTPPSPTYISDRVSIALRGANAPDAPVVKQILGGAPVKVLSREGVLLKIRTEDGSVGWVEPALVTTDTPVHVLYLESNNNLTKAQETINALQDTLAATAASTTPGDEKKIVTDLRAEIKNTLEHVVELEKHIRGNSSQAYESAGRVRVLEAENAALKNQLTTQPALVAVAQETKIFPLPGGTPGKAKFSIDLPWFLASLGLVLILGGLLGRVVMSRRVRRNHDEIKDQL